MTMHDTCTEPEGNQWFLNHGVTKHAQCLKELGHCPWCGTNDDEAFEEPEPEEPESEGLDFSNARLAEVLTRLSTLLPHRADWVWGEARMLFEGGNTDILACFEAALHDLDSMLVRMGATN